MVGLYRRGGGGGGGLKPEGLKSGILRLASFRKKAEVIAVMPRMLHVFSESFARVLVHANNSQIDNYSGGIQ